MLPWKSIIRIQKHSDLPVYLQIANSIIKEIKQGIVKPGTKMPGTRAIAELLCVHRQTVVKAYDELLAQDWLVPVPSKGTFVSEHLPEMHPVRLVKEKEENTNRETTGYTVKVNNNIQIPSRPQRNIVGFHDGPDVRLIPMQEYASAYRSVLKRKSFMLNYSYVDVEGKYSLRKALSDYLNDSRGLQTTYENIFITRGSEMGIYLFAKVILAPGDLIIVGDTNYYYADVTFTYAGAKLIRAEVDENGINVEQVEAICKKKRIRAVYVTSHHHYPTTVTLSAARRMKLLSLAEQYGFAILEDDYDYDFHYESSPILPLASADRKGMVVYIGTLSKTIAPALRLGYVVDPKNFILEISKLRQIIDVQGDPFMEQAIAELFMEGEIRRHMKKALKEYHLRRDFLSSMLKDKLSDVVEFKVPEGGLAIWAKFDKKIHLPTLSEKMKRKETILSPGWIHDRAGKQLNATRLGFGWMNMREAEKAVKILIETIRSKK
jgi:GntR family transcriptional regulator/MocR family aminotransferase